MKNFKLLLTTIFVIAISILFSNTIYAANTMDLNITDVRPYTSKKYTVTTPDNNLHTIFKIIKADDTYNDALYCLRSGLGFGNTEYAGSLADVNDVTYTESYNLKTNATEVMNYFRTIVGYTNISNIEYNSILWIVDNMYLPEHKDAVSMKNSLLNKVFKWDGGNSITLEQLKELTDDDIEFVQQMALWYFSNYDQRGPNSLSLADTYVLSNGTKIDELSLSEDKAKQLDTLYKYFVTEAKANSEAYGIGDSRDVSLVKPQVTVNSSNKVVTEDDDFKVIGPFNITKVAGNVDYNLKLQVTDKNGKVIPEKVDTFPIVSVVRNTTDMTPFVNSVEEAIGQGEFYLKISNDWSAEYDLTDVNIVAETEYEKMYKTTATLWIASNADQPVIKVEKEELLNGEFEILLNKVDEKGNLLLGANFRVSQILSESESNIVVIADNGNGTFTLPKVDINNDKREFVFAIEEITVPTGYIGINETIKVKITTKLNSEGTAFIVDTINFIDDEGQTVVIDGVTFELAENKITIKVVNEKIKTFDLSLRKYITQVNGKNITDIKIPVIDSTVLSSQFTADYAHRKDAVEVIKGDKVTYTISVFNEGDVKGRVTAIVDYLPEGLEFNPEDNPSFIEYKAEYEAAELIDKLYAYTFDEETRQLRITSLQNDYLFEILAFRGEELYSDSLEIVCRVNSTADSADKVLTNIATMEYKPADAEYANLKDRDSSAEVITLPTAEAWADYKGNKDNKAYLGDNLYFYKGQEDDDDFDKLVIRGVPFDLALRKFITKVNGVAVESREPKVDTSKLNTVDVTTGEKITTSTYTHSKEPVIVKQGDIVTFKIRVYNEGELDGYALQIADYIPEGLGYLMNYKSNTDNFWVPVASDTTKTIALVGENGLYKTETSITNIKAEDFYTVESLKDVQILTGNAKLYSTAVEDELIKAYNPATTKDKVSSEDKWQQSENETDGLYYQDVEITCIVLAENVFEGTLRNIAEIQEDKAVDENDKEITTTDRDSDINNVNTEDYNPPLDNSTYQQDDDDYELLELKYFDLALRKFITAVNKEEVTTRIPKVTINKEGNLEYVHDKTPVYVANSDLVTYTIRVYNEGTVAGYATEISDDIPDGLVFLPEHETNKQFKWVMLDKDGKETEDPNKANEIRTTYLNETLLDAYDRAKTISGEEPLNPDYADVKVVFQVIEENITQEDRIIINKAQITEDKAVDEEGKELKLDDEDSIPDEWNEGEDDQDIEKIYVQKFDLALLKWVTQTVVTVDGKTTTTDTGFTPYDDPEPIAKVVIDKNKVNKTTVKFVYNIIIMNQGEIAGYATEITDYIPEGLEFVAEDNPLWTKEGSSKITTRALEEKLLKPGETATVEVVFRWKNSEENFGLKTNIAEISEDYNDKGSKDIDSVPDNVETKDYEEQQEDDDDRALVILETKTGGGSTYIWLGLVVLLIIAGGIMLIQKFVI